LTERDVGPPEGVQAEAGEVASGVGRRLFERLPDSRIPHRAAAFLPAAGGVVLRKEPVVWMRDALLGDPLGVSLGKGPEGEQSLAALGLGLVHVAAAVALRDSQS